MTQHEDIDMVDNSIYNILFNIDKPSDGLTVREITRMIWNYTENSPTTEQFYNRAKLVERRIGAIRHHIFERIRKDMKEKEPGGSIKRPAFIPYALHVDHYHWKYLNCANYPNMPNVIKLLRKKAEGLNSNADVLDAVF